MSQQWQALKWFGEALCVVCCVVCVGCASGAPHPRDAVEAYLAAVEARDASAVYAMLDESARMDMNAEAFERYFDEHYDDILVQSKALAARVASQEQALEVEAQVPVAGSVAPVTWAEGRWYLAGESPTGAALETPRDTLEALLRALTTRDLERVMGLLSQEQRTVYVQEMDALRGSLVESLDNNLITNGDTAVLPLDNGDKILLVREAGVWKIQGYEQSPD